MGHQLVVSCGHYLAAVVGLEMRKLGGNAIDAGVAMAFAQSVVEFQSYGFGGEIPILIYSAAERRVICINGNMTAPQAATIEAMRDKGVTLIPGEGFLPAGVCAAPGALITALSRYGRLTLRDVMAPAIELAERGFPAYEAFVSAIAARRERFQKEWPTSADLFLSGGEPPQLGETFRNPDLARTLRRLIEAEQTNLRLGRAGALNAAMQRFYKGDIADEIVAFQRNTQLRDQTGVTSGGFLTKEDFAAFETRIEPPYHVKYRGYDVYKPGPWSQGPVFLQQLRLLEGFDLQSMGHNSAAYVHTLMEAATLAFSDRERYYGDPAFVDVPIQGLLSESYADERRRLIDSTATREELLPGNPYPHEGRNIQPELGDMRGRPWAAGTTGTRAVDNEGNLFSATPSGGAFGTSPIIPGLGFCLGTRVQSFWLDDASHPNALAPGKRPRTTLSPTLVMRGDAPYLAFGTPGGDQQDQWTLQFFLNVAEFGMDLQDAIDAPVCHSLVFPESFYPRSAYPRRVVVEGRVPPSVRRELQRLGHDVEVVGDWDIGFTTAVGYDPERRLLSGAASSRGERNYALGW